MQHATHSKVACIELRKFFFHFLLSPIQRFCPVLFNIFRLIWLYLVMYGLLFEMNNIRLVLTGYALPLHSNNYSHQTTGPTIGPQSGVWSEADYTVHSSCIRQGE